MVPINKCFSTWCSIRLYVIDQWTFLEGILLQLQTAATIFFTNKIVNAVSDSVWNIFSRFSGISVLFAVFQFWINSYQLSCWNHFISETAVVFWAVCVISCIVCFPVILIYSLSFFRTCAIPFDGLWNILISYLMSMLNLKDKLVKVDIHVLLKTTWY